MHFENVYCVVNEELWQFYTHVMCLCDMSRHSFICDVTYSYVNICLVTNEEILISIFWYDIWRDTFKGNLTYSYVTWRSHIWRDVFICGVTDSYVTWLSTWSRTRSVSSFSLRRGDERDLRGVLFWDVLGDVPSASCIYVLGCICICV